MKELNISQRELCIKLMKKRNFIYKIKGTYYLIGANVFRVCSKEEGELFEQYLNELHCIPNYPKYDLESWEYENSVALFRQISSLNEKSVLPNDENILPREKLEKILEDCKFDELENIKLQLEEFIYITELSDRLNFYKDKSRGKV